ncbi:hypothetical protein ACQRIU_001733 [Beauveria bassiana]
MAKQLYETFAGSKVTESMLVEAATLFNENYGTWGDNFPNKGRPVRLSTRRLREQYLPDAAQSIYTRVTVDGVLAGNAFACRWEHGGKAVCWVTQLVVSKDYRERGLATGLLRVLRADNCHDIYGIMSSHPAACLAAATAFSTTVEKVSLDFISKNAQGVMRESPIPYIRDAKLCGTIFDDNDSTGLVSGVNTEFFVDHEKPMQALKIIRESLQWPLGELPDGHDFGVLCCAPQLVINPAKPPPPRAASFQKDPDAGVAPFRYPNSIEIAHYAATEYKWGNEEVTLQDLESGQVAEKVGFEKVLRFCYRAKHDGFPYAWIDTCCIDKASSAELSEAINSMYQWYFDADRCYAYLADVPSLKATFQESEWFERGFTLQELLAPAEVYFLDDQWNDIGTKASLRNAVSLRTGIPSDILSGIADIDTASIAQRMSWAASRKTSRLENQARIRKDRRDEHQRTPLWAAADSGQGDTVNLLLECQAAINCRDKFGQTALAVACSKGHVDIVMVLLFYSADMNLFDIRGRTPLWTATANGDETVVRMLLQTGKAKQNTTSDGWTPVWLAVRYGYEELVKLLVSHGANIQSIFPLDYETSKSLLWKAVRCGHAESARLPLDTGRINPDTRSDKMTPPALAASNNDRRLVELLLHHGADVRAKDSHGRTPISRAADAGHDELVKLMEESRPTAGDGRLRALFRAARDKG